jgi:RNA polymerase-interacting CarD/CdnL/TRCF family regulator
VQLEPGDWRRSTQAGEVALVGVRTTDGYPVTMKLAVGDVVVYGTHGIGRIAAREHDGVRGATREVVVLALEDGLTVTLPLERAHEHLRPLISEGDMRRVQETLREDRVLSVDPWLSRRRGTLAKLTGGDPVELAEIVGDGALRERTLQAKGSKLQLSSGEREIFLKAWRLLSGEIAQARSLEQAEADGWIDEQLSRTS